MAKKIKKFVSKYIENKKLQKGGRKADSNFYRRKIKNKKIARITELLCNVDRLFVVSSVSFPKFKSGLIDRFLIMALHDDVEPYIIITKTDLAENKSEIEAIAAIYKGSGFPIYFLSNETGEGVSEITVLLKDCDSVLIGHSGVGKTTLLNLLDPSFNEKVQEISNFTKRGRHTTTTIRRHDFYFGGTVYDMPGLKEVDFIDIAKRELSRYYPEFTPYQSKCRFSDCLHFHEKDCGVKDAVEKQLIHPERYGNYINIMEDLPND